LGRSGWQRCGVTVTPPTRVAQRDERAHAPQSVPWQLCAAAGTAAKRIDLAAQGMDAAAQLAKRHRPCDAQLPRCLDVQQLRALDTARRGRWRAAAATGACISALRHSNAAAAGWWQVKHAGIDSCGLHKAPMVARSCHVQHVQGHRGLVARPPPHAACSSTCRWWLEWAVACTATAARNADRSDGRSMAQGSVSDSKAERRPSLVHQPAAGSGRCPRLRPRWRCQHEQQLLH
jgi:hypothetical protein